jgi:enoyl-CoA hydratase/carnithine racemase
MPQQPRTVSNAEGLSLSKLGHVEMLALDRMPGNRFSLALLHRFETLLKELHADKHLRAVVLKAEGPDFSYGADLSDPGMAAEMAKGTVGQVAVADLGQRVIDLWESLPVPTYACARGHAVGAGACLLVTADFPIVSPDCTIQFPEVDRGMHLSWGMIPRLTRVFGLTMAKRMALAGERIAAHALPPGTVRVETDPRGAALHLAGEMAGRPPLAVRAIKKVFLEMARGNPNPAAGDAKLFAETVGSKDFSEAVAAFFEKRLGRFEGK